MITEEIKIISTLYERLISDIQCDGISVDLRPTEVIGTVQDDPFDCWVEAKLKAVLPSNYEVFHAGKLTTPDVIVRDRESGTIIGLEIKKLIQRPDGKDSRGLTIDYNSCLPCGHTMVKVDSDTIVVPCYYLFALLNPSSDKIVTLIILDGDFLNYDFELHKEAKYSNYTEYNHGPYGEGSVRHRKMYTYPNPLNSQLSFFYLRQIMVLKKCMIENTKLTKFVTEEIVRTDKYGNAFYYSLLDERVHDQRKTSLRVLRDIFDACKKRVPKERVAYIPEIPIL